MALSIRELDRKLPSHSVTSAIKGRKNLFSTAPKEADGCILPDAGGQNGNPGLEYTGSPGRGGLSAAARGGEL